MFKSLRIIGNMSIKGWWVVCAGLCWLGLIVVGAGDLSWRYYSQQQTLGSWLIGVPA
jgi:hypothetical protein